MNDNGFLELLGEQWPSMVFVPLVLVLLALLAVVTNYMDKRDERARDRR